MSKKPASRRIVDHNRIDLEDREAIKYWTQKWGVTEEQLRRAVQRVGDNPAMVALQLGRPA